MSQIVVDLGVKIEQELGNLIRDLVKEEIRKVPELEFAIRQMVATTLENYPGVLADFELQRKIAQTIVEHFQTP